MRKVIAVLLVVFILASLAGCGSSSSESTTTAQAAIETTAESHETMAEIESITEETQTIETEAETPDYDDPSWTPPEAADPIISAKYNNPEDDPRMIVQKNWQSGDVAFIDDYNLIGYISGKEHIYYYIDENVDYIPAPSDALRFYTPPTAEDLIEYENHLGTIDLGSWVESLGVNLASVDVVTDTYYDYVCLDLDDGTRISINHNSVTYRVKTDSSYMFWDFCTPLGRTDDMMYATFNGEKLVVGHDMEILWVIERGLNTFKNDLAENPW